MEKMVTPFSRLPLAGKEQTSRIVGQVVIEIPHTSIESGFDTVSFISYWGTFSGLMGFIIVRCVDYLSYEPEIIPTPN
jgi:hypothetical protein